MAEHRIALVVMVAVAWGSTSSTLPEKRDSHSGLNAEHPRKYRTCTGLNYGHAVNYTEVGPVEVLYKRSAVRAL